MPSPISQPQEYVWTWNVFVTVFLFIVILPAASTMIVSSIKRHINKRDIERDKKDEMIQKLLTEKEEMKEEAIHEWRERHSATLCAVKEKVEEIAENMHSKVPFDICDQREADLKQAMRDLDARMRQAGR